MPNVIKEKYLEEFSDGQRKAKFFNINKLSQHGFGDISRLPISLRILLESVLRNLDGLKTTEDHIRNITNWSPVGKREAETAFSVSRVVLQDFTGVPLLVDLAAMRSAAYDAGYNPKKIEPSIPVDLVVDHSVTIDSYGQKDSLIRNMTIEFNKNAERYKFIKWGMQAFKKLNVVPPGIGIIHQVNLEYLFKGLAHNNNIYYPDTLVGTDSHTTMINGVGVLGWGVGGIEAEGAMLGQPVYILVPDVIGFNITGKLNPGITSTDLVLKITEVLRKHKVVSKFIEFYGSGLQYLSIPDRATISNMAPEYGATVGFFPVDAKTLKYMRTTGRTEEQISMMEAYFKAQKLWSPDYTSNIEYTKIINLDLSEIVPSVSGPKRPQDRIAISDLNNIFTKLLIQENKANKEGYAVKNATRPLKNGDVVIAAVTSCTNTSNPSVMMAAGLLAKKAIKYNLKINEHVKTSLAPGSRVVSEYLEQAGLQTYLDNLGFNVAAYGCTTCIGNSGDLKKEIDDCILSNELTVSAVLSGNRNFEARIHPNIKANFLASPPLVIAYALAGTMLIDIHKDVIGVDPDTNKNVYLKDLWPTDEEISHYVDTYASNPDTYKKLYANLDSCNSMWNEITANTGDTYSWGESTYIARPPFLDGYSNDASKNEIKAIKNAKPLLILGDSVTTDHISPAGSFKADSSAGLWLSSQGVKPAEFNSYGSRRGNHEVMMRGTFANIRIKNLMIPPGPGGKVVEGGYTIYDYKIVPIFAAAMEYIKNNIPTVIIAGEEYGTGSSRDWAAKGTRLLGVKVVIASSYERIHRSNLIGMGILPLQFINNDTKESLEINADSQISISSIKDAIKAPQQELEITIVNKNKTISTNVLSRLDTQIEVNYYINDGILLYILRDLLI